MEIEPWLVDIMFEFAMNYSEDGTRRSYFEQKKKSRQDVNRDVMRQLGFTEDDIAEWKG